MKVLLIITIFELNSGGTRTYEVKQIQTEKFSDRSECHKAESAINLVTPRNHIDTRCVSL